MKIKTTGRNYFSALRMAIVRNLTTLTDGEGNAFPHDTQQLEHQGAA